MSKQSNKDKQKKYRRRRKTELNKLRKQSTRMNLKMYAIRDSKAEAFHPPFYKGTHGEAERDFRNLINDSQSQPSKYPEDFDLYYVGEWDRLSGKVQPLDTPQHIIKGVQLKENGVEPMKKLQ